MSHLGPRWVPWPLLLLLLLALWGPPAHSAAVVVAASLAWRRPAGYPPALVDFLVQAVVFDEFHTKVGEPYPLPGTLDAGDGNAFPVFPIATRQDVDPATGRHILFLDLHLPYAYPSIPLLLPAVARWRTCCWPPDLVQNASAGLLLEAVVDAASAGSPVAATLPVVPVPAADADPVSAAPEALVISSPGCGTARCPLSLSLSAGGSRPPGLLLLATPANGSLVGNLLWPNASLLPVGLYAVNINAGQPANNASLAFLLLLQRPVRRCTADCATAGALCSAAAPCAGCGSGGCTADAPAFQATTLPAGAVLPVDMCIVSSLTLAIGGPANASTNASLNASLSYGALPAGLQVTRSGGASDPVVLLQFDPSRAVAGLYPVCFAAWSTDQVTAGPRCVVLNASAVVCGGHGTCAAGGCQCAGHWVGDVCDVCAEGWETPDCTQPYNVSLYAAGSNVLGQLGLAAPAVVSIPAVVQLTTDSDVVAVALGDAHTVFLTADGRVFTFGANDVGQLGAGSLAVASRWAAGAVALPGPIVAVAAGAAHTLALGADARLFAWGGNADGQLGTGGNSTAVTVPANVSGLGPNLTAVWGGGRFSYAVANGTVFAWGRNHFGQLATGDLVGRLSPTDVSAAFPNGTVVAMALGGAHALAVLASGVVLAVGCNVDGQLGVGSAVLSVALPLPVAMPRWRRAVVGAVAVAAGVAHSLVLGNDTNVYAFGDNSVGQLAVGDRNPRRAPAAVPRVYFSNSTAVAVAAGGNASVLRTDLPQLLAAGQNRAGQLGLGTGDPWVASPTPVASSFPHSAVAAVAVGASSTFVTVRATDFDPGRTTLSCFPTVEGLPTQCTVRLFDVRGRPYGGPEQLPLFRVLKAVAGDSREICPPVPDTPAFLGVGTFAYTWTSPAFGQGGRFQVDYRSAPLAFLNNTQNQRAAYMLLEPAVTQYGNPMKTAQYTARAQAPAALPTSDELFLFFKPTTAYDTPFGAELVQNGDAAEQPLALPGWNATAGWWYPRADGTSWGDACFALGGWVAGQYPLYGRLEQTVNVSGLAAAIDRGTQAFYFGVQTWADDEVQPDAARVVVVYADAAGNPLAQFDSGNVSSIAQLLTLSDQRIAPAGTRLVLIALEVYNADPATAPTAYFAHVTLRARAVALLNVQERQALVDLYGSTNGSGWTNSAGWLQGDPCDAPWAGVVCRFHRVVALQLAANNLRGPLPASIGALPFLEHLDVSSNGLTGPLPANLTRLTALRRLRVANNSLTALPDGIGELVCLAHLEAKANQIAALPPTLPGLVRIVSLDLGLNAIATPVPSLPAGAWPRLRTLQLQRNALPGPVPPNLDAACPQLQSLDLSHNQLAGPVPGSLANLPALQALFLDHNLLTGTVPDTFASIARLSALTLTLHQNQLSGTVPAFLQACRSVMLAGNRFACPTPMYPSIYDAQYLGCWEAPPVVAQPQALAFQDEL